MLSFNILGIWIRGLLSPARHLALFEHHGQFDQILADFAASCLATAATTVVTTRGARPRPDPLTGLRPDFAQSHAEDHRATQRGLEDSSALHIKHL